MSFRAQQLTLEQRVANLETRNEAYLNLINFLLDQVPAAKKQKFSSYCSDRIFGAEHNKEEEARAAWDFIQHRISESISHAGSSY